MADRGLLDQANTRRCHDERLEQGTQKPRQPAQEKSEVVAGGGEHGVDAVAVTALEMIAAHTVLGLHVADDRLDRGTTFHLAADRSGDAAYLAADPDAELLFVIMATIALVDMDAARGDPGLPLQFRNHRAERVAVERVAVQRFAVQHELAALGFGRGGGDRYLAPRTHTALGLCLCQCTPPREHAAHRPSARAGDDPGSVPAPPGRGDRQSALAVSRSRRSCDECRGSPGPAGCAGTSVDAPPA